MKANADTDRRGAASFTEIVDDIMQAVVFEGNVHTYIWDGGKLHLDFYYKGQAQLAVGNTKTGWNRCYWHSVQREVQTRLLLQVKSLAAEWC